jgi:hypothetical protein
MFHRSLVSETNSFLLNLSHFDIMTGRVLSKSGLVR